MLTSPAPESHFPITTEISSAKLLLQSSSRQATRPKNFLSCFDTRTRGCLSAPRLVTITHRFRAHYGRFSAGADRPFNFVHRDLHEELNPTRLDALISGGSASAPCERGCHLTIG